MPMFNAKDKLKSGSIKREDIPYMQRGGSWDNTDIKGGKLGVSGQLVSSYTIVKDTQLILD
jgi:hypothetical protein